MTRTELIKKIAEKSGIPDSDVKLFFEIFLKRLSFLLKIGQAAYVKDIGYFYLLKGKINQLRLNFIEDNPYNFIDLILFSLNKDLKSSIEEGLIFNVPIIENNDFQIIDTYFSLGIDKPLIPVRGTSSDEFYVSSGGYELRKLIESKVDKLVSETEILSAYENNPPQIILTSQAFNSNRIFLEMSKPKPELDEEIPDSFLETGEVKKEETSGIQYVARNFYDDLLEEIDKEKIPDLQDDEISESQPNLVEEKFESFEDKILISDKVENTAEEIISEELPITDELKAFEEAQFETESETAIEETGDFDSIETADEEFNIYFDEEKPSDETLFRNASSEKIEFEYEFDRETDESKESKFFEEARLEELQDEEKFEEVESPSPKINFASLKSEEKIKDEFKEFYENTEEESPFLSIVGNNKFKPEFAENKEQKKVRKKLYSYQSKKFRVLFLIVLIGSIVTIGTLYFYYRFQIKNIETKKTEQKLVLKTDNASIVERDFLVPVSYPYPKKETAETISFTPIDSEKIDTNLFDDTTVKQEEIKPKPKEIVKKENRETTKTKQPGRNISLKPPDVNYERVAPNIF
ncbi:MAG: hypothetical protein ACUVRG_09655, partial [Ignavibacterium sp.]|uniref:hypothetical protein n=1 Tax=Ignavibacterium sp. TaxID=2651167 RepID=UPI00404A16FF